MATARGKVVNADFGYVPRLWQAAFHANAKGKRYAQVIAGRQIGKTELALVELVGGALADQTKSTFAYLSPFIAQSRKVFWPRLKNFLEPIAKYCTFRESELSVSLPNGARIVLLGGENSDASRGLSIRGLVVDEFDGINANDWSSVFLPTQNSFGDDCWCRFIGTIGHGHSKLFAQHEAKLNDPDWYCQITPVTDAGVMTDKQLERLRLEMGNANFEREMLCNAFAPSDRSILGDLMLLAEMQKRITFVPHVPQHPVVVSFDLGVADATSVWFAQLVGGSVNQIAYREYNDIGLDEVLLRLRSDGVTGRYNIGTVILPNDVTIREGRSANTRLDLFYEMNFGTDHFVFGKPRITDTIQSCRINLQRCRFDKDECAFGIRQLKACEFVVDEKENMTLQKVRHDQASHAFDSFRYLCHWLETENPAMSGSLFVDYSKQKHRVIRSV